MSGKTQFLMGGGLQSDIPDIPAGPGTGTYHKIQFIIIAATPSAFKFYTKLGLQFDQLLLL